MRRPRRAVPQQTAEKSCGLVRSGFSVVPFVGDEPPAVGTLAVPVDVGVDAGGEVRASCTRA